MRYPSWRRKSGNHWVHTLALRSDCQQRDSTNCSRYQNYSLHQFACAAVKSSAQVAVDGIFPQTFKVCYCQGSSTHPPAKHSKENAVWTCRHYLVSITSIISPIPAPKMKSFLRRCWQTAQSHWRFSVLFCHGVLTSDRWSVAAWSLGSKSETSLAAAHEMRIDNRMMLNEGACQDIVRELTDLVKREGRHGGWILAG